MIDQTAGSVLFVGNFLDPGIGSRAVSEDLSIQLAARGWFVRTTSSRRGKIGRLTDMLGTCWMSRKSFDVAVVDVYSGPAFLFAEAVGRLLRRMGKPYVLTLHGGDLPSFTQRWPGRVSRLLRMASAVTAPSRYLQERMSSFRQDLRLLPNPLSIAHYDFVPRARVRPRLIWLRAFHRLYHPSIAVAAVAELASEFPDITLTMIGPDKGDGSLKDAKQAAQRLGVAARIDFAGPVPKTQVPTYLNRADIFLNTTSVDNTPVSVLEAMACGLCVVSTNVGGIPYLLDQETDALLVPQGDAPALAAAIRRILVHPELAKELSSGARRKVEQFDWSAVLPKWESLLSSVAIGRKRAEAATDFPRGK